MSLLHLQTDSSHHNRPVERKTQTQPLVKSACCHGLNAISIPAGNMHYQVRIRLCHFPQWRPKLHLVNCKKNTTLGLAR